MPAIEVVISLLLVVLFYSLLATVLMELISSLFSLRGKHLIKTLRSILSANDRREEMLDEFTQHPLYQQLAGKGYGKNSPPSYISSNDFRTILLKIVAEQDNNSDWRKKIESIPDQQLRELLLQYWEEAGEQWDLFIERIENWYDEIMNRASGWYKRNLQAVLLVLGLGVAVFFNVDIIHVYQHLLQASQDDLAEIVTLAETISSQTTVELRPVDSVATTSTVSQFTTETNEQLHALLDQNITNLKDPLGIGWGDADYPSDIWFWLLKCLGWFITAVCISKGAPFWFDLLRKFVNFRNTGQPPVHLPVASTAVVPPSGNLAPDQQSSFPVVRNTTSSPSGNDESPVG